MRAVLGFFSLVIVSVMVVQAQSFVEILDYLKKEKCNIPELKFPEDEVRHISDLVKLKRSALCALVQQGFLTIDGDFRTDIIRQNLYLGEPEVREDLIKKCAHKMRWPDDTAFSALICLFRHKGLGKETTRNNSQSAPRTSLT